MTMSKQSIRGEGTPGGSDWAGWNSDRTPIVGVETKQPRSRSYQESRRHERDRRDSARRGERSVAAPLVTPATAAGSSVTVTETQGVLRITFRAG